MNLTHIRPRERLLMHMLPDYALLSRERPKSIFKTEWIRILLWGQSTYIDFCVKCVPSQENLCGRDNACRNFFILKPSIAPISTMSMPSNSPILPIFVPMHSMSMVVSMRIIPMRAIMSSIT